MTDLIAKLRAALDEDERVARDAAWSVADHTYAPVDVDEQKTTMCGHWVTRNVLGVHKRVSVEDPGWDPKVTDTVWSQVADHIVRHDPARVLRQVAAMRKILDEHNLVRKIGSTVNGRELLYYCGGCGGRDWDLDSVGTKPCPTVLALAEAYGIEVQT